MRSLTRWAVALLLVAAVGPLGWWLTRPSPSAGPPVTAAVASAAVTTTPATTPSATTSTLATSPAAPTVTARAVDRPTRLSIPRLGVYAPVVATGVEPDGSMTIPRDVDEVGWYRFGPAPGAEAGSAVLAGHVDGRGQGPGALYRTREVVVGDEITVTTAGGDRSVYRVVARQQIDKGRLPVETLFERAGPPRLVLITCGGPFLREAARYRDNVVVVAVPR